MCRERHAAALLKGRWLMKLSKLRNAVVLSVLAVGTMTSVAQATDGYFQVGFGPRQSALGGAGVADSRDAMSLALNPAGIAAVPREFQAGAAFFMPFRGYETSGPGFVAPGDINSQAEFFVIPNIAYTHPIDGTSSIGFALYGNGGMNTTYADVANPACGGGSGVFCGGRAGVDLMQAFMAVGYAREIGSVKLGIAPTLAVQRFKAYGLGAYGAGGFSEAPNNLTNNGYDYSFGGGVRGGIEWDVLPQLRFGVSGQTKMYMSKFDKYAGLFEGQGSFDIPAAVTAGVAFDAAPDLTFMLDYQHIFYEGIPAVSNSSTTPALLGSTNGPGFGWHDVDVFRIGAEWRANDTWTFRAGYAYSDNPIKSTDVTFNILAPGVVQHHFTGGASYKISDNNTIEFSGIYVPESKVSGIEVSPAGPNPGRTIALNMSQLELLIGWTHKF
jgi:long-chain fatty acid transport protein